MSTMLHKVAAAIAAADLSDAPDDPTFDFYALTEEVADIYYDIARAAIEAMMEPTDGMVLSQGKSKPENAATETQRERAEALNRSVRHVAVVTWREMIQAAIKEQA